MFNSPGTDSPPSGITLALKLGFAFIVLLGLAIAAFLAFIPGTDPTQIASARSDDLALTYDGESFSGGEQPDVQTKPVVQRDSEEKFASAESRDEVNKHRVAEMPAASTTSAPAEGTATSKELRALIKKQKLDARSAKGNAVELTTDGIALAPLKAPSQVQSVVAAANVIAKFPYIWGGGHGSFQARGYDCSGSVSYALKGANLVDAPMTSGGYMKYGAAGPGKWITIYANEGHMFMVVGGMRFDTSFRDGPRGSRWQAKPRDMKGFVVRHPEGL